VQLVAKSYDQGRNDTTLAGFWTWFELIINNDGLKDPEIKDKIMLAWESHVNDSHTGEWVCAQGL
jgi:hypothetical protein